MAAHKQTESLSKRELILSYHEKGMSAKEMHVELGIDYNAIYAALAANGLTPNKVADRDRAKRDKSIVEAYQAGETVTSIAIKHHTSPVHVYNVLDRNAIPRRERIKRQTAPKVLEAVELYKKGHSIASIIVDTGCSGPRLYEELYKQGIKKRRRYYEDEVKITPPEIV